MDGTGEISEGGAAPETVDAFWQELASARLRHLAPGRLEAFRRMFYAGVAAGVICGYRASRGLSERAAFLDRLRPIEQELDAAATLFEQDATEAVDPPADVNAPRTSGETVDLSSI